ncbi:hypothetical protein [Castellaniella sp.]|uniref:hypothetical protein n=1 Tax=Castellaniella sp. TaxID=1955812 RepID=UPI002AFE597C|nr:hypothetical protein [Castellaniella sp.]
MMKEDEYIERLGRRCAHNINAEASKSTKRWVGLPWRSVVEEFLFATDSRFEIEKFLTRIGCPGDLSYTLKHCLNSAIINEIADRVELRLLDPRRMECVANNATMSRARRPGKSIAILVAAGFVPCDFYARALTLQLFDVPPAWGLTHREQTRPLFIKRGSVIGTIPQRDDWCVSVVSPKDTNIRALERELDWDQLTFGIRTPVIAYMTHPDAVKPLVLLCDEERFLDNVVNAKSKPFVIESSSNPLFGTW